MGKLSKWTKTVANDYEEGKVRASILLKTEKHIIC